MKDIIIDTDPGVDDALALLYALSLPAEFRILLVSLTFGNVSLKQCFRNAYTIFHTAHKHGLRGIGPAGENGEKLPVALGQSRPLFTDETVDAAHFHGGDGLGGIHASDSHSTPADWEGIFTDAVNAIPTKESAALPFSVLPRLAYEEILHVLQSREPQSVTIVAIGPLSNIAKAAISDPVTFSRVKEIVIMGGAVDVVGNANPFAEFNIFADPEAAAITFALTNPQFTTALPETLPALKISSLRQFACPAKVTLLPLDITRQYHFTEDEWEDACQGSELANWIHNICASSFRPVPGNSPGEPCQSRALVPHDALCLWYVLNADETVGNDSLFRRVVMDLRVETKGEWTKGMCCVDRRPKPTIPVCTEVALSSVDPGLWFSSSSGNCVGVLKETPGRQEWVKALGRALFGMNKD